MYPILYRKKTRTGFLLGLLVLALCIRLSCEPGLQTALWTKVKAVLGSETIFRGVVFLETGLLPERSAKRTIQRGEDTANLSQPRQAIPMTTEPDATETEVETEAAAASAPAGLSTYTAEEAEAISFRGDCTYTVDKAALLLQPLLWPSLPGPRVLIIHSHTCESYTQSEGHTYLPSANYRTLDLANNMVAVGDALAEALGKLGVEVIHDRTLNDYPDYNRSYAVAREKIQAYLTQYPSLVMVLDLHRDALEKPVRETVELNAATVAPLMLVIGTDEGGLSHPRWQENLSCGLKLQALANRETPELFKRLSFRRQRFNGDMTPGSVIVEVGSTENTLPEAIAAMPYLARYVEELLRCE